MKADVKYENTMNIYAYLNKSLSGKCVMRYEILPLLDQLMRYLNANHILCMAELKVD